MIKTILRLFVFALLTTVTQLGGVAFLISLLFKKRLLAFLGAYSALAVLAILAAPLVGKVALGCSGDTNLRVQSWFYCATNRNFVSVELADVLTDAAGAVETAFPGTETLVLDANFPFLTGFPLLPDLSHDDGEKADLAFFYKNEAGYLSGRTRSPIGYFAFEQGRSNCPPVWPSLRWDLGALQWFWRGYELEPDRTRFLVSALANDKRVGKIFIEPHLKASLGLTSSKVRFQGCRAARHDDHIHVEL